VKSVEQSGLAVIVQIGSPADSKLYVLAEASELLPVVRKITENAYNRLSRLDERLELMLLCDPRRAAIADDYEKIHEDDQISISQLDGLAPGKPVECNILHADKTSEKIMLNHSYNDLQLEWFKAGSAMNFLRKKQN